MERKIYQFEDLPEQAKAAVVRAPEGPAHLQRIGVILNTRSHHNKDRVPNYGGRDNVSIARPQTRRDIAIALAEFAEQGIGLLVISGGDGTVRDVLTMGQAVFGDNWPQLAVLPRGKTNALNVDLGSPRDFSLAQAIASFENSDTGKRVTRRPLAVSVEGSEDPPMLGFIFGAGAFALGVEAGQDAHRAGFFNSIAVGVTSAWGVVQALFGSDTNVWRRGAQMKLDYLPSGEPMPHSRHGDPERRTLILASTLTTMPLDIKLFGKGQGDIRLLILDAPRRRVLFSVPAILAGWHPEWLAGAGLHHLSAKGFAITLDAPFILDGEHFPAGSYRVEQGPELTFVAG
ncbi:acylglycerol kinase family protein [Qipengyuania aquimaris]|uniref:acylglycerol kinase family protein n=1 Tax=Qipengyuania aquimaris TaxID=255984 RepID=UPI001C9376A3|nr:acylglycerol kinase family protein [Qipengyuania aquimaris]MBY6127429.1 acylglycerol kinase family protein [Qipengyuania aquimaris]